LNSILWTKKVVTSLSFLVLRDLDWEDITSFPGSQYCRRRVWDDLTCRIV
jgi:hypothetical protein